MKDKKITKQQITLYKKYTAYFQKELGLMSYRAYFSRTNAKCYASVDADYASGTFTLNIPYTNPEKGTLTPKIIRDTCFHEMLHVLFEGMKYEARARYTDSRTLGELEEHVVNTLEQFFSKLM